MKRYWAVWYVLPGMKDYMVGIAIAPSWAYAVHKAKDRWQKHVTWEGGTGRLDIRYLGTNAHSINIRLSMIHRVI